MKNVIIIGATSAIAEAVARLYAKDNARLVLLARNQERLKALADDLRIRGASFVETLPFEAADFVSHSAQLDQALAKLGAVDIALIAHGSLSDQKACAANFEAALAEFEINALSVLSLCTHLANVFEARRAGTIAVIGSVAGDRGRQSNYVYAAAKGAVDIYLQGLRNRLFKSGVHVLTIKPGFVDTPMTASFKKGPLWASPEKVAKDIVAAIEAKKDVLYTPLFWSAIMRAIQLIPESLFKRSSL